MATIHRATDMRTGRSVAIKILRPEIGADRELADRFRREVLATTVLRHPNIVACLDTGSDPAGAFMVMELIDGEDLAARIRRDGALAPADVARMGLDVARGLGAAHVRGIVHRDVKPSNILLARDGRALITDFGIARLAADAEAALPGTTLGSVQYFSPEQAQGKATTAATDVYGLGLVMYEALTARRPWSGATTNDLALARVGAEAPSPRDLRANVPPALDAIVMKALAAEPERRYGNGGAMAAALEPLVSATDRTGTSRVTTPVVAGAAKPVRPYRSDGGLRRSLIVFGIMGLGLLVAGLALSPRDGGTATTTSEPPVAVESDDPATPEPTAEPTPDPTAEPTPTPEPTPEPTPTPPPVALCEPFLGIDCAASPGRYTPTPFVIPLAFTLGDGWSVDRNDPTIVRMDRAEGSMLLATDVSLVDKSQGKGGNGSARALIAALAKTDGLTATKPANVRIDDRGGRSIDVTAEGGESVALFSTAGDTYVLQPGRTTRLVALDIDDDTVLLLVIEPAADHTLRDILDTADDVAASLTFD
jgi:serine/threonine-protein kinase